MSSKAPSLPPPTSSAGGSSLGSLGYALGVAAGAGLSYVLYRNVIRKWFDPERSHSSDSNKKRQALLNRFAGNGRAVPEIDAYERVILMDLAFPDELTTSVKDIGGLEEVKQAIHDVIILPMVRPDLFQGLSTGDRPLLAPPRGILFYGPPGTGKTMMAKAIAKDSGAVFINLRISTLLDKWVGESQRLVRAVFSLAEKLAPTIVFIDEIDGFLRKRSVEDQVVHAQMKSEFMSLWDGLATSDFSRVIVMGATNRPHDLDKAILRRLPRAYEFTMPNAATRKQILSLLLRQERLGSDVNLNTLADLTQGYSGSDLKEMCKCAVLIPMREMLVQERKRELAQRQRLLDEEAQQLADAVAAATGGVSAADGGNDSGNHINNDNNNSSSSLYSRISPYIPFKSYLKSTSSATPASAASAKGGKKQKRHSPKIRALRMSDFVSALADVQPTGAAATKYGATLARDEEAADSAAATNSLMYHLVHSMNNAAAAAAAASNNSNSNNNNNNRRDFDDTSDEKN